MSSSSPTSALILTLDSSSLDHCLAPCKQTCLSFDYTQDTFVTVSLKTPASLVTSMVPLHCSPRTMYWLILWSPVPQNHQVTTAPRDQSLCLCLHLVAFYHKAQGHCIPVCPTHIGGLSLLRAASGSLGGAEAASSNVQILVEVYWDQKDSGKDDSIKGIQETSNN